MITESAIIAEILQLVEEIGAHVVAPLLRAVKARDVGAAELSLRVAVSAAAARKLVDESAKPMA